MNVKDFYTKKSIFSMFDSKQHPILLKEYFKAEDSFLLTHITKGSNLIDIGCGEGKHFILLSRHCDKLVGIDFSKIILDKTKQKTSNLNNIELFLEDANKTHFPDHFFDNVICMFNTFGNMEKELQLEVLLEMKRIVKENGKIFISVYSENAKEMQKEYYALNGFKIVKEEKDRIYLDKGLISERFTVKKLENIFALVDLKMKISKLTEISLICESLNGE